MKMSNIALFYQFYTSLHFGSGTTLSYVDLPVEREIHTGYPVMPSTGIKGVFRANYQAKNNESKAEQLFGKGDEEGKLIFTDGRILFFPVKSARGVFVWITSQQVLSRFEREVKLIKNGFNLSWLPGIEFDNDEQAFVSNNSILINNYLVLEELSFEKKKTISLDDILHVDIDKNRIAILSNDMFSYFVKNQTEINARIKIDQKKGTVQKGAGALWYEELVPAESVFYSLMIERKETGANEFVNYLNSDNGIFQFGGDETLGRGFAKVTTHNGGV
jgi:CRISPR-associated protein Cmr4